MKVREIIETYYPAYSWYGQHPASQCAAFNSVDGPWGILGNFGRTPLTVNGIGFKNSEQLFHMMKFRDPEALKDIHCANGLTLIRKAKKWEKTLCRPDWPTMLVDALKFCLQTKYDQSPEFRGELQKTAGLYIVEDESKRRPTSYGMTLDGDKYTGSNLMGRLLMELRDNGKLEYHLPPDALDFIDTLRE